MPSGSWARPTPRTPACSPSTARPGSPGHGLRPPRSSPGWARWTGVCPSQGVLLGSEGNRLEDDTLDALARASIDRVLAFLKKEREGVVRALAAHAAAHERIAQSLELLQSVPGIGPRAAMGFLAETAGREFESAEQLAAYAGVCPSRNQSGKREGPTQISRQGNARLRTRFYLPAVVAKKHNPLVKALYERLVQRGMPKKAAVVACLRNLLMICYAILKSRKPYDAKHQNAAKA